MIANMFHTIYSLLCGSITVLLLYSSYFVDADNDYYTGQRDEMRTGDFYVTSAPQPKYPDDNAVTELPGDKNTVDAKIVDEKIANISQNLLSTFLNSQKLKDLLDKPLVHGVLLPAVVGVGAALLTVCSVCCIHTCVRSQARKRRKLRIKNLADELKSDKTMLLGDDSDEEI